MSQYIPLIDYGKHMKIEKGDAILVSSDAKKMIWDAISNRSKTDLNQFIYGLINEVGTDGTVIFPTYNWDFCNGIPFDIKKTPCMTGSIGSTALKRKDFIRTKHPLYSFAVHGKLASTLANMNNLDAFGPDSPFAFFKENNIKNYVIDVSLQHCFTFVHYAEEQAGCVKHRYIKNFTAGYIDENGVLTQRTYSMFVRDLSMNVETTIDPIEHDLIDNKAEEVIQINNSEIKKINLKPTFEILMNDIKNNDSRKLCTYIGQQKD